MTGLARDQRAMLAGMSPTLDPSQWCFVTVADQRQAFDLMPSALATFREDEGLSLVVPVDVAHQAGHEAAPYARITLGVYSALDGVGLTAAVSAVLAGAGIACNVVAAYHHDHVFVPAGRAREALLLLQEAARPGP